MDVKQSIAKLTPLDTNAKPLGGAVAPDSIASKTGFGAQKKAGSGIVSPVTEDSRTNAVTQAVSSDGLFVWTVPEKIQMTDAAGTSIEFVYNPPV